MIHLSTPEQIQYLLGRRDFTVSHCTTSIHLDAVRAFLCEHFQSLMFVFIFQRFLVTDCLLPTFFQTATCFHFLNCKLFFRNFHYFHPISSQGHKICARTTCYLEDYAVRSGSLENLNFLQFVLTTEETTPQHNHCIKHYPYMVGNSRNHCSRVKHLHEVLPHFKGYWIPRLNDNPTRDLHHTMLLLLLKPWHTLQNLHAHSDWSQEFAKFMISAHSTSMWIALNFQFFHVVHDTLVE